MEHLSNCHGEWNLILGAIYSVPFLGVWLRGRVYRNENKKNLQKS